MTENHVNRALQIEDLHLAMNELYKPGGKKMDNKPVMMSGNI